MAHIEGVDNPPEYLHLRKWEHPQDYVGAEWPEYYEVIGRTRDSEALERSNFNAMLAALGGENEDAGVIVVRATHWMVGWVETIMIHESATEKLEIAEKTLEGLEDYPVTDEDDYSKEQTGELEGFFNEDGKQSMENILRAKLGDDTIEFLKTNTLFEHFLRLIAEDYYGYYGEVGCPSDIGEMREHLGEIPINASGKIFRAALDGKPLEELMALEQELSATENPDQTSFKDIAPEEFKAASVLEPEDIIKTLATTGYTDPAAMLRAQYLLGMAKDKMFGKAVKEIKSKFEKEMKDRVTRACKWGTNNLDETSVKDIIAKVLMENGIYPYPQLLAELYKNPFGKGTTAEPTRESMQKPITALAAGTETLVAPTEEMNVSDQWMSNPDYPSLITETMDATVALELEMVDDLPASLTVENILMEIDERKDRFEQIIGGQLSEDDKMAIIDDVERDYLDHIDLIRSMASKKNA